MSNKMIFVSYAQLAADVATWSERLPQDIDAIAGITRSGMLPATLLALHRNIKLTSVEDLVDGRIFDGGNRDQHRRLEKVLVLDDSALSGRSIQDAKVRLSKRGDLLISYGVVYKDPRCREPMLSYRSLPIPRIFEWNWLHHFWMTAACVDIDGVLCCDPSREENDDGPLYSKFLTTTRPRYIPTVGINTLVTSRLERYRFATEAWLARYNINYKKLIMHPAGSGAERRKRGDHARRKAAVYRASEYQLFIESSERQAKEIATITGKPVLCTDRMELY